MRERVLNSNVIQDVIQRLLNLFPDSSVDNFFRLKLKTQLEDRLDAVVKLEPSDDPHHLDGEVIDEEDHHFQFHIDL